LVQAVPAYAASRVALVIGNSSYQNTPELKNPRNDAESMAKVLNSFGFLVIKGIDVDQFNFKTLVRAFTREIKDADLALFFYAGHGLQVGERNFLLPTDAELKEEADLDFESLELSFILQQMERKKRTNIILMDACRDNPFAVNLARNMGTRSSTIGRGLAAIDTGVGTFVGFATQPGNVALDGTEGNSPFTTALLNHLAEPGLDIGVLMRRVREDVINSTDGKQVPWSNSSLVGDSVVLNNTSRQIVVEPKVLQAPSTDNTAAAAAQTTNMASVASTANAALELSYWNTIKDANNPSLLRAYLLQYPNGTFAGLAKAMLSDIDEKGSANRKKENEQKVAALNTDQSQVTFEAQESVAPGTLARNLQAELQRVGCIAANPDGVWGPMSRNALKQYGKHSGLQLSSLEPTLEIFDHIKQNSVRVCPLVCGGRYTLSNGRCELKTCSSGYVLTKNGNCIAQRKSTTRKKTATRKRTKRTREVEEEVIVEPRRKRKTLRRRMFDNEKENCPQCITF
jgi:hypothetical protein